MDTSDQEEWQQELLSKYGNIIDISMIDATYQQNHKNYDLPLFLSQYTETVDIMWWRSSLYNPNLNFALKKPYPSSNLGILIGNQAFL